MTNVAACSVSWPRAAARISTGTSQQVKPGGSLRSSLHRENFGRNSILLAGVFRINEVAQSLRDVGNDVTVLTGQPNYPDGEIHPGYSMLSVRVQEHQGLQIHRVPLLPRGRGSAAACTELSVICRLCFRAWPLVAAGKEVRRRFRSWDVTYSAGDSRNLFGLGEARKIGYLGAGSVAGEPQRHRLCSKQGRAQCGRLRGAVDLPPQ